MTSISKKTRFFIAERAMYCCEYCLSQENYSPDYFSVEHIMPKVRKGRDSLTNLAYSCLACNSHKYTHTEGIDPVLGVQVALFNPRIDIREFHFCWSDDFSILTGLTPKGRATIDKLHLNRISVVNLRKLLATIGKHPPF